MPLTRPNVVATRLLKTHLPSLSRQTKRLLFFSKKIHLGGKFSDPNPYFFRVNYLFVFTEIDGFWKVIHHIRVTRKRLLHTFEGAVL